MSERDTRVRSDNGELPRCWPGCCDEHRDIPRADELRCECGCLLARLVADGIELKCRRCRRVFVVPLTEGAWTRLTIPRTPHDSVRGSLLTGMKHSGRGKPANPRSV
jgi:phage FluMu protein Com